MMTGKLLMLAVVANVIVMATCRLENYSVEFRTVDGVTFTEKITETETGEFIILENGNTVVYDFDDGLMIMKFKDRNDCYMSSFDTEAVTAPSSEEDFQSLTENEVDVKYVSYYIDRSASLLVENLPEAAQNMCTGGDVYRTKESRSISKRGDDEIVALIPHCSYYCLSSTECYHYCFHM